jgi:SEC-C motif
MTGRSNPRNIAKCRLCSAKAELQLSHIYPRFAVKYLKESSATGFFKNFTSNERLQESRRVYLLCENCEQVLSKDEKTFCEHIFMPLHKQNQNFFEYGKWLIRFLVGLHWKILVTKDANDTYPEHAEATYAKVEGDWRTFLLGHRADPGCSEFHLFFTDVIEHANSAVPNKLNWYMVRALDGTPTFSKAGQVGSYVKLLRMMSYAFITPRRPEHGNWVGTEIGEQGKLNGKQEIEATNLWPLIESRLKWLESAPSTMSERQMQKLRESAMRDPDKFLNSESTRVFLADRELERRMAAPKPDPSIFMKGRDRNPPCPCKSGKKLKNCCG